MLDTTRGITLVEPPGVNGTAPTVRRSRVVARLAAGVEFVNAEFLAALSVLGGIVMIIYAAYSVDLRLGHAAVGVALILIAKLLYTPAPVELDEQSEQDSQPDGNGRPERYEGVRRR